MQQLSFDLVMVPLACVTRPASEQTAYKVTLVIDNQQLTESVPLWVLKKGRSFLRGWMKPGRQ